MITRKVTSLYYWEEDIFSIEEIPNEPVVLRNCILKTNEGALFMSKPLPLLILQEISITEFHIPTIAVKNAHYKS
jgi:hypothetical protein